jgi:hypothetical protein
MEMIRDIAEVLSTCIYNHFTYIAKSSSPSSTTWMYPHKSVRGIPRESRGAYRMRLVARAESPT